MADNELHLLPGDDDESATLELLRLIDDSGIGAVVDFDVAARTAVAQDPVAHAQKANESNLSDNANAFFLELLDVDLEALELPDVDDDEIAHKQMESASSSCEKEPRMRQHDKKLPTLLPRHVEGAVDAAAVSVERSEMPKETKKKTRTSVKDELAYLRRQVRELEQQLHQLQHAANDPNDEGNATYKEEEYSSSSTLEPSVWERVAQRQKHEKIKTEVENAKLREMLEGQLKVANSLARVLRKRPETTLLETSESSISNKKRLRLGDGAGVYETLTAQLETLYPQLDAVFAETGLSETPDKEVNDVQIKSDDMENNGRVYMELIHTKIFPFDLATTSRAVWQFAGLSRTKLHNGVYGAIDSSDEVVRSEFTVTLHLHRGEVLVHVQLMIKKIVEAERVVLLWSSMGTSEGSLIGSQRINISESGWTVIREISNSPSISPKTAPRTILQSIVWSSPEILDTSESGKQQAGVLTDLIMSSYHQNMEAIFQRIENLLMTQGRC
ncbi:hypothetical protein FI667_g9347, partial [Globisporangium splendens]